MDEIKQEKHKSELETRNEKCEMIREAGMHPYAGRFGRTHLPGDILSLPEGTTGIRTAGRVVSMRVFGKLVFIRLFDQSGSVQVALQRGTLGDRLDDFLKLADVGDFIGVSGDIFITRTGEKSVNALDWTILTKSLRPLPEKFHGLADTETRMRKRYLEMISSPETMQRFLFRTRVIRAIRGYLDVNGFLEIDTPVLINRASGAMATPFRTHHNALDIDIFLRIAPETYLKRAVAGGFDRVYEFARCFRNEGMDPSHLPDFTLLEYYASYWNYEDNMNFTEKLIKHVVPEVTGSTVITFSGTTIDFGGDWPRIPFRDLILNDCGIDINIIKSAEELLVEIGRRGIELDMPGTPGKAGLGTLFDLLYKKVSRPKIKDPLFVIKHPVELSPLARRSDTEPGCAERFQLVVNGWEIVNAYSELVDSVDQAARFAEQLKAREAGDMEAMEADYDFLSAMEYGMPPMSGWGMGIDRFVALLTDTANLRDVVLFPLMRPEQE